MSKTLLPPCELMLHNREQLIERLRGLYDKGYRYIVRDKNTDFVYCYSHEPRKYREYNCWGYRDPDVRGVLPAYPINSMACPEVNWSNKVAFGIERYLK